MKIAVVGKGNVGGGLADRWERAGHEVTRIGKDGGDVSDAEAVLVAVPGGAIADAFERVNGWNGKTVIDNQEIPGITGGAIDSHEGSPGPIYLQGDHGGIAYRNIVLTPAE